MVDEGAGAEDTKGHRGGILIMHWVLIKESVELKKWQNETKCMFTTEPRKYPCFVTEKLHFDESTDTEFLYEDDLRDMLKKIRVASGSKTLKNILKLLFRYFK